MSEWPEDDADWPADRDAVSRPRWEGEGKPSLEWIKANAEELAAWFESDAYELTEDDCVTLTEDDILVPMSRVTKLEAAIARVREVADLLNEIDPEPWTLLHGVSPGGAVHHAILNTP